MYTQLRAVLESRGDLTAEKFDQLLAWWQKERGDAADLPAFLVRQGMLTPADGTTLSRALEGTIPIDAAVALLTSAVLARPPDSTIGPADDQRTEEWASAFRPAAAIPEMVASHRFGPYSLVEQVGHGPRAAVYRAEDTRSGRTVAVKIFVHPSGGQAVEDPLQQARAAGRINHPNCLPILESGWEGAKAYVAMPFARDGSAEDVLRRRGPMPPTQAARVCRLAAQGLAAAHAANVPHGNLKPSNILLGDAGDVWLADFGPRPPTGAPTAAAFTTDLRAFAAVIARLLTDRPPAAGVPDVPAPFGGLVAALLAVPPAPPCASAAQLAQALAATEGAVNAAVTAPLPGVMPPPAVSNVGSGPVLRPPLRTAHSRAPAVGDTLGKCLLTAQIGQGGAGIVYRAEHEALGITVAVKVLNADIADPDQRAQVRKGLRREAKLLAKLNHPNVVRMWEYDESHVPPYLVLEFIEGPTLAELIPPTGGMPVDQALRLIEQVAGGLAAAHELGIIHRDVKPANVLVAPNGRAKLTDLGLAYMINSRMSTLARPQSGTGMMAGTVAYVAPEQAMAAPTADHRADIYSLGATFFHLVTGRPPFPGGTILEMLHKHAKEPPPVPHLVAPHVPRGVSATILRMLAKNPSERHQTYVELCSDLHYLHDVVNVRLKPTDPVIHLPADLPLPPAPPPVPPRAGWLNRLRSLFGGRSGA